MKSGIVYSHFILFFGILLVCSASFVPELSKRCDNTYIMENSKFEFQNTISRNIYKERSLSIFCIDKSSCTTASLLNFAFIENLLLNVNKFVPTDTIEHISSQDYENHKLAGNRLARWYYGYYLFISEYSLSQKIFGGGFNYMEKFGLKFKDSKFDYPHNPFIDSFLFSGIIGGLTYLYFIFLVFYNYVKYLKYHPYFFLCFIVVFFFSVVSANTHFSIPIFTFLSLVPFFTKYLIEKERKSSLKDEIDARINIMD